MAKISAKISAVLCGLGIVGFILGQALSYWVSGAGRIYHAGLWENCADIAGYTVCAHMNNVTAWFNVVRALEVIADMFAVITISLLVEYIRRVSGPATLKLIRAAFLLAILTAVLSLIGIIIYGAKYNKARDLELDLHLDWSFALTTGAGVLFAVVAVLLMLEVRSSGATGGYISI